MNRCALILSLQHRGPFHSRGWEMEMAHLKSPGGKLASQLSFLAKGVNEFGLEPEDIPGFILPVAQG